MNLNVRNIDRFIVIKKNFPVFLIILIMILGFYIWATLSYKNDDFLEAQGVKVIGNIVSKEIKGIKTRSFKVSYNFKTLTGDIIEGISRVPKDIYHKIEIKQLEEVQYDQDDPNNSKLKIQIRGNIPESLYIYWYILLATGISLPIIIVYENIKIVNLFRQGVISQAKVDKFKYKNNNYKVTYSFTDKKGIRYTGKQTLKWNGNYSISNPSSITIIYHPENPKNNTIPEVWGVKI